jgi:hypothetical protein
MTPKETPNSCSKLLLLFIPGENGVYILENLYPRTTYDFRFGAKNLVGYSEWSAGQQYTMPQRGPPEAPKIDIRVSRIIKF